MLELGADEKAIHARNRKTTGGSGIDFLIGVRGLAQSLTESASANGLRETRFFNDSAEAGEF
jgi:hypothetical protein